MLAPSQMPDEYAETLKKFSSIAHTAMVKQLWGIGWLLAIWKEGGRLKRYESSLWVIATVYLGIGRD
jgi:hypothetical protein